MKVFFCALQRIFFDFFVISDGGAIDKAIESLNGTMLGGGTIVVEPSKRSDSKCYV